MIGRPVPAQMACDSNPARTVRRKLHLGLLVMLSGATSQHVAAVPALPATTPATVPPKAAPPPARPPVDPTRLAIASEIAAVMMPKGALRQSMQANVTRVSDGIRNGMLNAPMRAFVRDAAIKPEKQIRIDEDTAIAAMAVIDPAFAERQRLIADIVSKQLGAIIDANEPKARAGLSEAYARRLTIGELEALLAFLKTPAGAAFASAQTMIIGDPAMLDSGKAIAAETDKSAATIMKEAISATQSLPRPRRFADLTESEKAQVFRLIGATPASTAATPGTANPGQTK